MVDSQSSSEYDVGFVSSKQLHAQDSGLKYRDDSNPLSVLLLRYPTFGRFAEPQLRLWLFFP